MLILRKRLLSERCWILRKIDIKTFSSLIINSFSMKTFWVMYLQSIVGITYECNTNVTKCATRRLPELYFTYACMQVRAYMCLRVRERIGMKYLNSSNLWDMIWKIVFTREWISIQKLIFIIFKRLSKIKPIISSYIFLENLLFRIYFLFKIFCLKLYFIIFGNIKMDLIM